MHQATKEEIKFNINEIIESIECISFISFSFHIFPFWLNSRKLRRLNAPGDQSPDHFIKLNEINSIIKWIK